MNLNFSSITSFLTKYLKSNSFEMMRASVRINCPQKVVSFMDEPVDDECINASVLSGFFEPCAARRFK